ncbi:hypothetical protein BDZ90DRAFT_169078 [Jaminaea rosea]|uniref:Uncharacterized protein n=1 Tax=Jaminaea rosea TaxID=1569628 RepID=A0A316UQT3_9BASI|nr:hypothetical protein BDZ90DRAFT_169078 [Jaminaea rosea]PWN27669.1 hypothetical protein BDZ90DRAFT_169078 [Jaminaea rosea]
MRRLVDGRKEEWREEGGGRCYEVWGRRGRKGLLWRRPITAGTIGRWCRSGGGQSTQGPRLQPACTWGRRRLLGSLTWCLPSLSLDVCSATHLCRCHQPAMLH